MGEEVYCFQVVNFMLKFEIVFLLNIFVKEEMKGRIYNGIKSN